MESSVGPMQKLVEGLVNDPGKLAAVRAEFDAIAQPYYKVNEVHQDFIMTRAKVR
jgi:hypothetical protein